MNANPSQNTGPSSYDALVERLNENSARRVYHAFTDVAWDAADMSVDATDPSWQLTDHDPLAFHAWYQEQPPARRQEIGLYRAAETMKVGIEFENVLQRGLLLFATTLPNGSPEFRYVYHELAEETQHSLMFQEFINRSGMEVAAFPADGKASHDAIIAAGRDFPELLFMDALIGEDIIDYFQRRRLADPTPPILQRIYEIHIKEEARHRSFARAWLTRQIPRLSTHDRRRLEAYAPALAVSLANRLLAPSISSAVPLGCPQGLTDAILVHSQYQRLRAASLAKTKAFCRSVGLLRKDNRNLWHQLSYPPGASEEE